MGVCSTHFPDRFIKQFIDTHIKEDYCDYCREAKPCANFEDFYNFINDAVYSEYCEPYEAGAWYDPDGVNYEDRFPGLRLQWKNDLLDELLETEDYDIIEDLAAEFDDLYLARKEEIYGPTRNEYFLEGWNSFKEVLKHKIRFLFFSPGIKSRFREQEGDALNPAFILKEVGKSILELGFIIDISPYELSVYRARQHKVTEYIHSAAKLGSPPPNHAKANRMSPAGISMFYGALDTETCRMEIVDPGSPLKAVTSGEFVNTRRIRLVDFTNVGEVPSLFDEDNRNKRSIMGFILSFTRDLSIPVRPDDSVHIEYIPTQVVTEYIRIKLGKEQAVNGILYNSVKNPGGKCVVLFAEYGQISNSLEILDKEDNAKNSLYTEPAERFMVLLNDSVVTELI